MAKQSGLHQIRGKVGEHSYYRQTGVQSGLIRSINQGMSQRVKTGDEYANVRLNNAEFGQAGRIAKVLGRMIVPKYRPMVLPFSQSKMAKVILEAIKTSGGEWGQRNLTANDASVLINALNSVHKNNPDDWGFDLRYSSGTYSIFFNDTILQSKLNAIDADYIDVRVAYAAPWIGTYVAADKSYGESYARANFDTFEITQGGNEDLNPNFRPGPPQGWPAFAVQFLVVIILPVRTVGNQNYTLQEHCCYLATELPAAS